MYSIYKIVQCLLVPQVYAINAKSSMFLLEADLHFLSPCNMDKYIYVLIAKVVLVTPHFFYSMLVSLEPGCSI